MGDSYSRDRQDKTLVRTPSRPGLTWQSAALRVGGLEGTGTPNPTGGFGRQVESDAYLASTATQNLNGNLDVDAGGVFTGGSGTVSVPTVTLAGGTLTDPTTMNVSGDFTITGGTYTSTGGTVNFDGVAQSLTSDGMSFDNVSHNGTGTLSLADSLTLTGNLDNVTGGFDATNRTINIAGNWTWSAGTLTSAGSTVNFTSSGTQTFDSGNQTYDNLSDTVSGATLSITDGTSSTVTGTLTLSGASGNLLTLTSNLSGSGWVIGPKGYCNQPRDYVDLEVKINGASAGERNTTRLHRDEPRGRSIWAPAHSCK